jgi:hypothetical protein
VPLVAALLLISFHAIQGAKIFAFFAAPASSHMTLKSALIMELAVTGHHVTVVSPFPETVPFSDHTVIVLKTETSKLGNNTIIM